MKHLKAWIPVIVLASWFLISGCAKTRNSDLWGSGILEATEIVVSSQSNGLILEMRCDEGDCVKAGDVIAVIDTSDLVLQRAGLLAQRDEVDARARGIRLTAARAQQELNLARLTADRTRALFDQGSATEQVRDEAMTRKAAAQLSLEEIRNGMKELEARRDQVDNALSQLQKKIDDSNVLAPSSGAVTVRSREPGELVRYGEAILTLADLDTMWMKIYLKEEVLSRVALRARTNIRVDALGDSTLVGEVTWISSEAEFTPKNIETRESRTGLVYAVKIEVPNPNGVLKIGMPAEAEILASP